VTVIGAHYNSSNKPGATEHKYTAAGLLLTHIDIQTVSITSWLTWMSPTERQVATSNRYNNASAVTATIRHIDTSSYHRQTVSSHAAISVKKCLVTSLKHSTRQQ